MNPSARALAQASLFDTDELPRGRSALEGAQCARDSPETYRLSLDRQHVERFVQRRNGTSCRTSLSLVSAPRKRLPSGADLASLADASFLRAAEWPALDRRVPPLRVVDLFSGCGAMTLGLWEAARAVRKRAVPVLALDMNRTAAQVYKRNFPEARVSTAPIETLLDGALGAAPTPGEAAFIEELEEVDILVGGPPCQGHSDLNNHTRRVDPKNRLYERMARFAELVAPTHIIVENVPAVMHDRGSVVEKTSSVLAGLGYNVDQVVAEVSILGVAQRRRRHVLVASLERRIDLDALLANYARDPRTVAWAIGDLRRVKARSAFDTPSTPSPKNRRRMRYLFENDEHDLPDRLRPDCHRLKNHSYRSVYGRMYWDQPAQTITSGFMSMGQGRFVHPKEQRTLTPHEAARLQFIPDFFKFDMDIGRTALARMIGNAVPPKLTYAVALELLR